VAAASELSDDLAHKGFGIAEEHQCPVEIVQRVVDSRETGCYRELLPTADRRDAGSHN